MRSEQAIPTVPTRRPRPGLLGLLGALWILPVVATALHAAPRTTPGEASPVSVLDVLDGNSAWCLCLQDDADGEEYHPLDPDPMEDPLVSPESELLDRGRRNPWMAALASLVLPGAGQFYNSATSYAFTLKGFRLWMYVQGGVHAALIAVTLAQQAVGTRVEFLGGGSHEISARDAQTWRILHGVNALLASVSAFVEAHLINRAGRRYVMGMRLRAYFLPAERTGCVEVAVRF